MLSGTGLTSFIIISFYFKNEIITELNQYRTFFMGAGDFILFLLSSI